VGLGCAKAATASGGEASKGIGGDCSSLGGDWVMSPRSFRGIIAIAPLCMTVALSRDELRPWKTTRSAGALWPAGRSCMWRSPVISMWAPIVLSRGALRRPPAMSTEALKLFMSASRSVEALWLCMCIPVSRSTEALWLCMSGSRSIEWPWLCASGSRSIE
jgi:hypothetical protein